MALDMADAVPSDVLHIPEKRRKIDDFHETSQSEDEQSLLHDARKIVGILNISENLALSKLRLRESSKNRVELIINELMENPVEDDPPLNQSIISNVDTVYKIIKSLDSSISVDRGFIEKLLEANSEKENVVDVVVKLILTKQQKTDISNIENENSLCCTSGSDNKSENESKNRDLVDVLREETEHISTLFPDKDQNEIYAYLEHYHTKNNRVTLVIEEMLGTNTNDSQESTSSTPPTLEMSQQSYEDNSIQQPAEDQLKKKKENQFLDDINVIRALIPDCEPNYIAERLYAMSSLPDRVTQLTTEMIESKNYPKLKEYLTRLSHEEKKKQWLSMSFHPVEFLKMCPDPLTYYYDGSNSTSQSYIDHCLIHLNNTYPMLHSTYINKIFTDHKKHLSPAIKVLTKEVERYNEGRVSSHKKSSKFRQVPRQTQDTMPTKPDEHFYRELLFIRHETQLRDYIKQEEDKLAQRRITAKERGDLLECTCCYDPEVLPEDMTGCSNSHIYCKHCVQRSAEALIENGILHFPCLAGPDCSAEYSLQCLQGLLPANVMSLVLKRIQDEEVREAGIEDLVECPFCNFATIMPNTNDKVLVCLNPECLKPSCRLCKEENHIPLTCDELEKKSETNMRTYLENKMAEAMIRTCHKCKNRFYKTEGCNKMTCSCGASMCYVCREPITGYEHFQNGRCNEQDAFTLHSKEIKEAASAAKEQYKADHPDAGELRTEFDPERFIEKTGFYPDGGGESDEEYFSDD